MKIAYITAGAGGMYCGSCLRDNTLAAALMQDGHEVLLIPTYTPTRTDEHNVSINRVFLGGLNIYLQEHFRFFRRTPYLVDRLLDFAPLLRLITRWGISVDPAHLGGLTLSMLRGTQGFLQKEVLKLVRFLAEEVAPDVINIPNSLLISLAPAIKAEMNIPVCCTLQGEDLFLHSLPEPYRSESLRMIREHAPYVDAFVAVSRFGAQAMTDFLGIERSRIHVVPLGINFDGYSRGGPNSTDPFTIGYLARIAPEKGLHALCDSYGRLRSQGGLPPSRLWAAGYLSPENKPYIASIRKNLDRWGVGEQFQYFGELDRVEKLAFLRQLSVFSVPGPYADPKGLFLLEAMASGVPVIQPRSGAFTEIVENTGGGILVEPDNPDELVSAIRDLWNNPQKRAELGARGYEGVRKLYSAKRMSQMATDVYQSLLKQKGEAAVALEAGR
jgi:glycosyltransferase involved in cell wall biosynthesis